MTMPNLSIPPERQFSAMAMPDNDPGTYIDAEDNVVTLPPEGMVAMWCASCAGRGNQLYRDGMSVGCGPCGGLGYVWVMPDGADLTDLPGRRRLPSHRAGNDAT